MNDTIGGLVVHLYDVANVGQTGYAQVAHGGGAGGQDDLLASPGDDGEGTGRESPRDQAAITEVPEESGSQEEGIGQDCLELQ